MINICVSTVYIYVYINTHTTCMYIFKKNMLCLYIKYIYIYYKLYEYKYISGVKISTLRQEIIFFRLTR